MKAVDALTIDPSNRLRREVKVLEEKQNEIEIMKLKHDKELKSIREETDLKLNKIIAAIQQYPKLAGIKVDVLKRKIR